MDRVRIYVVPPPGACKADIGAPERRGPAQKRLYEIFSDRNGTLHDDGRSAPIVSANTTRTNATSGDATPAKNATPAKRNHPP